MTASDYRLVSLGSDDGPALRALRQECYLRHAPDTKIFSAEKSPSDELRDRDAWINGLWHGERLVASLRILPITHPRAELVEIGKVPAEVVGDAATCELSRAVALPREDGGVSYGIVLLRYTAERLMQEGAYRRVTGYCRMGLVPYWVAAGARLTETFFAAERGREYAVFVADLERVVGILRQVQP